jgi:hypothetical protein
VSEVRHMRQCGSLRAEYGAEMSARSMRRAELARPHTLPLAPTAPPYADACSVVDRVSCKMHARNGTRVPSQALRQDSRRLALAPRASGM